jgi:hypothetical protein
VLLQRILPSQYQLQQSNRIRLESSLLRFSILGQKAFLLILFIGLKGDNILKSRHNQFILRLKVITVNLIKEGP